MKVPDSSITVFRAKEAFCEPAKGLPKKKALRARCAVFYASDARRRQFLEKHAGGRSWAAYIREKVFRTDAEVRRAPRRPRVEEKHLATVLSVLGASRLAANVNQLAKSANMGTLDVSTDVEQQLRYASEAILEKRKALFLALGLKP